ncbi:MAG: hypothetical protein K8R64_03815 [Methanosarcinaceae archaeon]|nr:hypothetical protein [Methanosarcinaceae archaeon]
MKDMRYMSLVFRGAVEDYERIGVRPSVFMDSGGDLNIYLCDPVIDDPEAENHTEVPDYEANGGQFTTITGVSNIVDDPKFRQSVEAEYLG